MVEKYQDLESVASQLGIQGFSIREAGGKVSITGRSTYQLEKDLLWDAIKKHAVGRTKWRPTSRWRRPTCSASTP